jgi:hypothetical protein
MFSYQWDWTSYITVFTGQERLRCWAKLYWRFFLKVFRWTWNWGFLGWSSTYIPPLFRGVVQGFGQGCSWAGDESSVAGATFTMLSSSFLATGCIPLELLMEIQYASGAWPEKSRFILRDVSWTRMSHHWVSPCFLRLESLFPFSVSPPLAGGNIVMLGDILLDSDSCVMPVFQTLGILDSWDLAAFFDSCGLPDSCRCLRSLDFLTLYSLLDLSCFL